MSNDSLSAMNTSTNRTAPAREIAVLTALCAAVLIAQIDTSVTNLAVQPIGHYFRVPVATLQWVVDAYNLVYAALLLSGGLLADLFGRRRVFVAGAAVFAVASGICALAPGIDTLLAGRVLAGLGAACLMPASLALIRVLWPDAERRARVLGIWAACNGLAFAIGPVTGGLLIDAFGWRSVFVLALPFALLAAALALGTIPESAHREGRHFDVGGQVFGALSLGALALAGIELQRAPILSAMALAIAAIAGTLFVRVESRHGDAAMVPLPLFRQPVFQGAMAATAIMTFGMYGAVFLLPLTWQTAGTLGPAGAGFALMPMALVFALSSPFSGHLTRRLGLGSVIGGGLGMIGVGLLVVAGSVADGTLAASQAGLVLAGLGMGLATGPLMGAAVGAVEPRHSGSAAALVNVARMAGATLGVAVLGTLYAVFHPDVRGLTLAMTLGGSLQIAVALWAWRRIP